MACKSDHIINACNFIQELTGYNHRLTLHGLKSEIHTDLTLEQHKTLKQNLLI